MKRFTSKASMLLVAMLLLGSAFVHADKRYVFALGSITPGDGVWQSSWVDYRLNDVDRTLYIWPDGSSMAGASAVGTGSLGQSDYLAFTVGSLGWWGCGYYCLTSQDMTDVDVSTWSLHFAIRTDCAADITVSVYGSTATSGALDVTPTGGKYVLTTTTLPLAKRDKKTWTEFTIPLSSLAICYDQNGKAIPALVYNKKAIAKQNYLTFAGGNDTGSFIAWDNVYLTNGVTSAVESVKVDKLDILVEGNQLKVSNNTNPVEIYSVSGARVISSKVNDIDISNLAAGVYVVKAGSKVSKFTK